MDEEIHSTIRGPLNPLIGHSIVEITQSGDEDGEIEGNNYVHFHFSHGWTVTFLITADGFHLHSP